MAFNTTLGQLKIKRDLIIKLDGDISDTIKDDEELETELDDADAYLMELEEKIAILEEYVKKAEKTESEKHILLDSYDQNKIIFMRETTRMQNLNLLSSYSV